MHISSSDNGKVKELVKLRTSASERYATRQLLLSGRKVIEEVALQIPLMSLWQQQECPPLDVKTAESFTVTAAVMRKITGLEAPDGYAAVVPMPQEQPIAAYRRIIALDAVSDPANMGTMLRSAYALGWDAVILLPGCCDPYNDKALRACRAAALFLPWRQMTLPQLIDISDRHAMLRMAAQLRGTDCRTLAVAPEQNLLLVLGNEGQGVSDALSQQCQSITIAMNTSVESLNVGAAAAILMWHLN